jgi:hypothetical protein
MSTMYWVLAVSVISVFGGGYLGYVYGKSVQKKAQELEQAAKVAVTKVL